jgi:Ca2+-binding RTX toxin-like protein
MSDNTRGGDDLLIGGSENDRLVGDGSLLSSSARGGNDLLVGGSEDDILRGDADTMTDSAQGGNDVLIGGSGNDELYGDALSYENFSGTRGADRFVFKTGSGQDTIGDFQPSTAATASSPADVIQIRGYGYHDFADLLPNISDDASGNAVVYLNGMVDQVTLLGVQTAQLSAADFAFTNADLAVV